VIPISGAEIGGRVTFEGVRHPDGASQRPLAASAIIEHIRSTAMPAEIRSLKPMPPFAARVVGAVFATTLLSGAMLTGTVLLPPTASAATDSDGDGLTDDFEARGLTDPQNPDSDRDGLNDGDELHRYYTGPTNQDSDSDGVSDGDEVLRDHTDPNFNPGKDPDGDGLETPEELDNHLDPQNPDSDRDGLLDGEEMRTYHTGPLNQDTDGDGLSDDDETKTYRTDPNRKDTDRDGRDDGVEVKNGTNPRVPII
jgi:hypothetical protein